MTIGELALYFNDVLKIHADLHVVPVQGWRRDVWFDLTGLPWVKPSPNMPSLQSAMLVSGAGRVRGDQSFGGTRNAGGVSARRRAVAQRRGDGGDSQGSGDPGRSLLRRDVHAA